MPWSRRLLRNMKVYARVDAKGELVAEGGLVSIKYRANDTRLYSARAGDLKRLDESDVLHPDVEGEAPAARDGATKKPAKKTAAKKVGDGGAGPAGEPRPGAVAVYTDGACTGNPGPAGLGVVLLYKGHRKELSEYLGLATNNIAELTAVLRGLESIKDATVAVDVCLDSSYSIGVLTKNWKPKANVDLIARIRHEMLRFADLRFVKVPGHAGVPENERADALARAAVESRGRG